MREIEETYPAEFRGGVALRFLDGRGLVAAQVNHRSGPGTSFFGGTEFWVYRSLALRVGYAAADPSGGFSYRVSPDIRFDYAATDQELGMIHRFGFPMSSAASSPTRKRFPKCFRRSDSSQ